MQDPQNSYINTLLFSKSLPLPDSPFSNRFSKPYSILFPKVTQFLSFLSYSPCFSTLFSLFPTLCFMGFVDFALILMFLSSFSAFASRVLPSFSPFPCIAPLCSWIVHQMLVFFVLWFSFRVSLWLYHQSVTESRLFACGSLLKLYYFIILRLFLQFNICYASVSGTDY